MAGTNVCSLCILGSTGSIGTQTLDVVRANQSKFRIAALVAGTNTDLLIEQIREFSPGFVSVKDEACADVVRARVGAGITVVAGREGAERAAALPDVDVVLAAIVGFEGLFAVMSAVSAGKHVALANKESLVAAGELVMREAAKSGSRIIPVDSEHSSIYQCLFRRGIDEAPRRVILTASGGPFLNMSARDLESVRPEDAIRHPTWSMGVKNSLDSATLMNKGLEVIEAAVLFGLPAEKIEVLIHPECMVHGFVEYEEGTMLAAMFTADMKVPISFALKTLCGTPADIRSGAAFPDLASKNTLRFIPPDTVRFPALEVCYRALRAGGSAPAALNAANEVAVESFMSGEIGFTEISRVSALVLESVSVKKIESLADVIAADAEGRCAASNFLAELRLKKGPHATGSEFQKGKVTSCPGL